MRHHVQPHTKHTSDSYSWGQHGAHLGPVGPRWAPCWPHEPCYLGSYTMHNNIAGMIHEQIGVEYYWPLECLIKSLFMLTSNRHQRSALLAICDGNPPVTGGFPSQRASNVESMSISWCHHEEESSGIYADCILWLYLFWINTHTMHAVKALCFTKYLKVCALCIPSTELENKSLPAELSTAHKKITSPLTGILNLWLLELFHWPFFTCISLLMAISLCINPCHVEFILGKIEICFNFVPFISTKIALRFFFCEAKYPLILHSCIVNIWTADDLVTQGAKGLHN